MDSSADIIRKLEKDGWKRVSQKGSHVTFKKEGEKNLITVPHPRKEIGKSLERAIKRAAGW